MSNKHLKAETIYVEPLDESQAAQISSSGANLKLQVNGNDMVTLSTDLSIDFHDRTLNNVNLGTISGSDNSFNCISVLSTVDATTQSDTGASFHTAGGAAITKALHADSINTAEAFVGNYSTNVAEFSHQSRTGGTSYSFQSKSNGDTSVNASAGGTVNIKIGGNNAVVVENTGTTVRSLDITDTTASTNKDTGALVVDGGVGIEQDLNVGGDLAVIGDMSCNDLTVNGTTTTINSNIVTIDDPIFQLGGDTAPVADDNKDRGIAFRWHNGVGAKNGFFGYDDSTGEFIFVPDATFDSSDEVVQPSSGADGPARFGDLGVTGNITVSGTVDGRDVAADGTAQDSHIADSTIHYTQGNITATGALNSGSITSGFGNIDNGSSTITTTGAISGGSVATTSLGDITAAGSLISSNGKVDWGNGVCTLTSGNEPIFKYDGLGSVNNDYALKQSILGNTSLNASTGQVVSIENNGTEVLNIDSTGTITQSAGDQIFDVPSSQGYVFKVNGSQVANLDQTGVLYVVGLSSTGTATAGGFSTGGNVTCGDLAVTGALSKGSGSFRIPHPLPSKKDTHDLVHSFVEGPQADNIYRGKVDLVNGSASINIDTVSGMTDGTFVLLNREVQCFTTNETGWCNVRGSVSGNILTIESQNPCTDTISWMVIGERKDQHMYDTGWTDENGKVIVEPEQDDGTVEEHVGDATG